MPHRKPETWEELRHLTAAFEALLHAFERSADAEAREMAPAIAVGLASCRDAIAAGPDGRWPAGVLAGVRQGARDLRPLIAQLPAQERIAAAEAVMGAGGRWLHDLLTTSSDRAMRIISRGRILTDDEYDVVRHHIDELEAQQPQPAQLPDCYALVEAYSLTRPSASGGGAT